MKVTIEDLTLTKQSHLIKMRVFYWLLKLLIRFLIPIDLTGEVCRITFEKFIMKNLRFHRKYKFDDIFIREMEEKRVFPVDKKGKI